MFTGIVEHVGKIKSIKDSTFVISHKFKTGFKVGESMALNGACMTIIHSNHLNFSVVITGESRDRTSFNQATVGTPINLERSAIIGQRNSGHDVAGHIDETGEILSITEEPDLWRLRVKINSNNRKYMIEKGSIAVEGISLTISDLDKTWFEVAIIPHTWEHTNLQYKKVGDRVNIEYDQAGKYILNANL